MTNAINFTKPTLDQLTSKTKEKRTYYNDKQVSGLSIAIQPSGAKSFYVIKKIAGRSAKIFLGKYPDLSIENARKLAKITLGQIALGENPLAEKHAAKNELTFGKLFEQYMNRYSKPYKKTWKVDEQTITRFCGKWFNRKLSHIKRDDCQRLHETISAENGRYMANSVIRRLRAIYNKGIEWGWQGMNPAKGIKKHREHSRDRFIQPMELRHVISAITAEADQTKSDFFMLLLLTGVRKTNAMTMRWEQINWDLAEWRIPVTKNGDPVTIPLTDQALDLLRKRHQSPLSPWVFPSNRNKQCHLQDLNPTWRRIKERATIYLQEQNPANSLMDLRIHDIRRTFGSYQAMSGASLQVIGKSLGHKSTQATQIYARLNIEAVRASVVTATNTMLAL